MAYCPAIGLQYTWGVYGACGSNGKYKATGIWMAQAVDRLYRTKLFTSDEERLGHLFQLYEEMTQPSLKAMAGTAAKEQLV